MIEGNWQTEIGRSLYGKTLGILWSSSMRMHSCKIWDILFGIKIIASSFNTISRVFIKKLVYVEEESFFKQLDILSIHT